jgi:nitroreductase
VVCNESNESNDSNDSNDVLKDVSNKDNNRDVLSRIIRNRRSVFPKQYTLAHESVSSKTSSNNTVPQSTKPCYIPDNIVNDILEKMKYSPTHHLTEPWCYVVYSK